jgi:Ca-activated chloride channel family protein
VSPTGRALPLRGITLEAEALGGIARTKLRQRFFNDSADPLELVYTFALPADGAVSGYEVQAGKRRIKGRVDRREDARAQYEAARLEGRTAALVEQERPNLFTQHLGNIPASTDVNVELTIDQPLQWVSGFGWEWRFPTVVAPRYLGAEGVVADGDRVTVDVLDGPASPTASIALTIGDDLPAAPTSPTHAVVVASRTVSLANGAALDRDIVVRWAVPGQAPVCSVRTARPPATEGTAGDAGYGLLTIVPPIAAASTLSRDLVLLLDVSGSMNGQPLEHLKAIVTALVGGLEDDDRLEMIAFSSGQKRYRGEPVRATAAERASAIAWIQGLNAGGGTEMIPAIGEALRPLRHDSPRQVVVVTDGLIGFEASAVRAIRDRLPRGSRLHAVGVGSASNRAFLRPAARAGRGIEVLIGLDEPATGGAERIVAATREPVVSDVSIEGTALFDAAPRLQDLSMGSPVLTAIRLRPEGGSLVVRGRTARGPWEQSVEIQPASQDSGTAAIPALWAREAIEDLELDLACGGERASIDQRIEQIALHCSVSSRLTSWVAIAEEPDVDPRNPLRFERIPQTMPYGMSEEGLGLTLVQPMAAPRKFGVYHAPETDTGMFASLRVRHEVREVESRQSPEMARQDETRRRLTEIDKSLERLEAERQDKNRQWERLRAEHQRALERLEVDRDRWSREWDSRLSELKRRRAEIAGGSRPSGGLVPLPGRVLAAPGRSTAIVEIRMPSELEWRPETTATVDGRSVTVVDTGTTRPGWVSAGSLVRLELAATADEIRRAKTIEIGCGGRVLIVAVDAAGRISV